LQALVRGKRDRRAAALNKKNNNRTQKTKRPLIIGRTAYKSYVGSYTQTNTDKVGGVAGVQLLRNFTPQIRASLSEHGGLKIHISSTALYRKSVDAVDVSDYNSMPDEALSGFWHTTHIVSVTNDSQVGKALKELGEELIQRTEDQELHGSGWVFVRFKNFELHLARYKPLKGSSWFDLPPALKRKQAIVNVKNTDQQCFKWAVLSAVFPAPNNPHRLGWYTDHESDLDWSGLTFPVTLADISKFERRNQISIHVYGWEQSSGHLLRKSDLVDRKQHINLLLLQDGVNSHYSWIKTFSRFAYQPSDGHKPSKQYCMYCLHGFPSAKKLDFHLTNGCREITEARPMMPDPDEATLEFKSPDKQFKAPYVIYADFECITEPISKANKNSSSSYTEAYQSHTPCGFCYQVVSSDPSQVFEPEIYRGEDTINEFLCRLRQTEDDLMELIKANTPMVMTAQDEQDFQSATCCNLC
jgi:hypothetical protein